MPGSHAGADLCAGAFRKETSMSCRLLSFVLVVLSLSLTQPALAETRLVVFEGFYRST